MEKYQKILVVIDPKTDNQKALKRAIELAEKTNASITALLTIYDFSYEMTTILSGEERETMRQSLIKDRQLWLTDIIEQLNNKQLVIKQEIFWHNRPFEQIIEHVLDDDFDIVIKGTHEHDKLKSVIFTPTDWHLLRKCPCPVLLVKDHDWPKNGNIVASLNIGSEEPEHQSLNEKITTESICLGEMLSANVHLVNSYPGTPVNITIEIPEFDANEYNQAMLKHHAKLMKKHAKKYHVATEHTHVYEGLPEDVIEKVAKDLDAELVVLGTVGRTGLSAALIGNTAEHVIDKLNCDLLALKPDGYSSPLAED